MKQHKGKLLVIAAVLLLLFFFSSGDEPQPRIPKLKLVLFIVADQLPQEYLRRFRPFLKSGIAMLLERGAVFTNARFQHSKTDTCPGHASLLTGAHPAKTGVIANWWYDRQTGKSEYCVDDPEFKQSPRNLMVRALGDWLKEQNGGGRVFTASAKDRSAILMGGKTADAAFWYNPKNGKFKTSEYYQRPNSKWRNNLGKGWLKDFNAQRKLEELFGTVWNPLPADESELSKAKIVEFDQGVFARKFPYHLGSAGIVPDRSFYSSLYSTPFVDLYLADLAATIIEQEQLGQADTPDMLALSFSALDTVGHGNGPNSREVLDTLIRLDLTLGELFKLIDQKIGLEHVLIAFSSDHAVQPFPELWHLLGRDVGHRQDSLDVACIQSVWKKVRQKFGTTDVFLANGLLDSKQLAQQGIEREEIEESIIGALEQCPMIEKIWSRRKLLDNDYDENTPFLKQFQNGFYPGRSADFIPQLKHLHLYTMGYSTGHGTPYDYDSHVPLIFFHPSIPAKKIEKEVALVDAAPTLAGLLGLEIPDWVDGNDHSDLLLE